MAGVEADRKVELRDHTLHQSEGVIQSLHRQHPARDRFDQPLQGSAVLVLPQREILRGRDAAPVAVEVDDVREGPKRKGPIDNPQALLHGGDPLVIDKALNLIPVDVKMDIDENALFRQRDIARLRDMSELEPLEAEARLSDLNFIKLNGTVGCMVNGAGLAMATMDFIALAGARPANFLDVGGVATPETISLGMEILLKDRSIQAIFINIFGGIVRCDKVAEGIAAAAERLHPSVPVIIRLSGSNVPQALEILEKSGMKFMTADTVEKASRILKGVLSKTTKGGR